MLKTQKNKKIIPRWEHIMPLMVFLGFLIGMIMGYVAVGNDIEYKCEQTIESYQNYINGYCVNRPTPEMVLKYNLTGVFTHEI